MNDSSCSIVSGLAQLNSNSILHQPPLLIDDTLLDSPDPIASSTYHKSGKTASDSVLDVQDKSGNRSSSLGVLSLRGSDDLLQFSPEKARSVSRRNSNGACKSDRTFSKMAGGDNRNRSFDNMDFDNDISMRDTKIDKKELDDLFANMSGYTEIDQDFNESVGPRNVSPKRSVFSPVTEQDQNYDDQDVVVVEETSCNLEPVVVSCHGNEEGDNLPSDSDRLSKYADQQLSVDRSIGIVDLVSQRSNDLSRNRNGFECSWNKSLEMSDFSKEFVSKSEFEKVEFMKSEEEANKVQHRFIQEEALRSSNINNGYDTSTWSVAATDEEIHGNSKPDWVATANGSRVSISTFLQLGSGPLGTLDSSCNSVILRPNFGKPILSPINNPITLMDSLSKSRATTRETTHTTGGSIDDCMSDDGNTTASSMTSYVDEDEAPKTSVSDYVMSKVQENIQECLSRDEVVTDDRKMDTIPKQNLSAQMQNSSLTPAQHLGANSNNSTDVLSLSAIGKLISDMSLGANASRLAEVILKAKEDLTSLRRNLDGNATNLDHQEDVTTAATTSFTKDILSKPPPIATKSPSLDVARKRKLDEDAQDRSENVAIAAPAKPLFISPKRSSSEICINKTTLKRPFDKHPLVAKENLSHVTSSVEVDVVDPASLQTTIFTNKRILGFGCVELGQSVTQLVSLQNRSNVEILNLKIYTKYDADCFQVLNVDSKGCLLLHPNECFQLKILFKPSAVKFFRDRIVLHTVSSLQKFCVPVIGYGGCAKLEVTNLPSRKGSRYDVIVKSFDAAKQTSVKLALKNVGTSPAFFKTFVYSDVNCITLLKDDSVKITPSCGVIAENAQMELDVVCSSHLKRANVNSNFLACLGVHWGEEITRRRLRDWEKAKMKPVFVKGNKFTDVFTGENDVQCLYQPFDSAQPILPEDARFFVGHLRECQINLFSPEDYASDVSRSFFPLRFDDTLVGNESVLNPNMSSNRRPPFQSAAFSPPVKESSSPRFSKIPIEKSNEIRRNIFSGLKENVKPSVADVHGITVLSKVVNFVDTTLGASDSVRVEFRNNSAVSNTLKFKTVNGPFSIRCPEYRLDARKLLRIPVYFEPNAVGKFTGFLNVTVSNGQALDILLNGNTKI